MIGYFLLGLKFMGLIIYVFSFSFFEWVFINFFGCSFKVLYCFLVFVLLVIRCIFLWVGKDIMLIIGGVFELLNVWIVYLLDGDMI